MLADDAAVAQATLTDDGIVKTLRQGAIHISMSTISVALSKELAQAHARAGQRFVAAPVFGRPEAAAAAQLFIVTAGDPAAVGACQPLFDAMGQKTLSIGTEPSAANLVNSVETFCLHPPSRRWVKQWPSLARPASTACLRRSTYLDDFSRAGVQDLRQPDRR